MRDRIQSGGEGDGRVCQDMWGLLGWGLREEDKQCRLGPSVGSDYGSPLHWAQVWAQVHNRRKTYPWINEFTADWVTLAVNYSNANAISDKWHRFGCAQVCYGFVAVHYRQYYSEKQENSSTLEKRRTGWHTIGPTLMSAHWNKPVINCALIIGFFAANGRPSGGHL